MNTYKFEELNAVANLLGKCKNDKDLKYPATVLAGIRIIRKIEKIAKKFNEEQQAIFVAFDVQQKEKEGSSYFEWTDKDSSTQSKINDALLELSKTEYSIDELNTMDEEDFIIYTKGLDSNVVAFLYNYLVKSID